jgi:hypothetical protein
MQVIEADGPGVRLASLGPGSCPAVAPDGSRLACYLNPGAIPGVEQGVYIMQPDGSGRRHVGAAGVPLWSPDGKKLLTVSFGNPYRMTLVNPATRKSSLVQIPAHTLYSVPSWVDNNTIVSVVSSKAGLCVALVDLTEPNAAKVKVALWQRGVGLGVEPAYPVYATASRRCYFIGREPAGMALYGFGPGEVPQRLEAGPPDGKMARLALSPDGRYLLFCCDRL